MPFLNNEAVNAEAWRKGGVMKFSDLSLISDDEWQRMSEEEKIAAIKEGKADGEQVRASLTEGSDERRRAARELQAELDAQLSEASEQIRESLKPQTWGINMIEQERPRLFYADQVYKRIQEHINYIQSRLKEDEQLLVDVPLCTGEVIRVASFGYYNPNFIILWSYSDGVSVLISHTNVQVKVLITKKQPDQRSSIGFLGEQKPKT
jgi:hypothetical protein